MPRKSRIVGKRHRDEAEEDSAHRRTAESDVAADDLALLSLKLAIAFRAFASTGSACQHSDVALGVRDHVFVRLGVDACVDA